LRFTKLLVFSAFVGFELVEKKNRFLVIWTTTPWTLPSNLAIAVHPDLDYVVVHCKDTSKELILLESRLGELFKKPTDYEILERFKGLALKGLEYKPVFPYFEHLRSTKAFRVVMGTFITTDQGTGVVHEAPYFGEVTFSEIIPINVFSDRFSNLLGKWCHSKRWTIGLPGK
jgi:isoleucyl-tRNA synthetase